jgi:archaeosine synthase beta-subunit
MTTYPAGASARDRFVLGRRASRPWRDPWQHQGVIVEDERDAAGRAARVATVFLTGRECPWRCVMCDLWRFTIAEDTPPRAIPAQIGAARRAVRAQGDVITQMKLYNAGSFFDPRAVPERDYDEVAAQLTGLGRVIVESHPALVGDRVDRLIEALERSGGPTRHSPEGLLDRSARHAARPPQLEVAMGLETAHPVALEQLHKRITVDDFARAAERLRQRRVALRAFLLISPPFVPPEDQELWLLRSVDVAFSCGASVVSLVPTRPGNGAIDALTADGLFRAPRLDDIERSFMAALAHGRTRGRVFVDIWDLRRFAECLDCFDARRARLLHMNLEQRTEQPGRECPGCGSHTAS